MNNKLMSLLGLARRANKLSLGNDVVIGSIKEGKAKLIIFASDLSERTLNTIEKAAIDYKIQILKINESMDEISNALSKRCGVISINDAGFALSVRALSVTNKEENVL